MREVVIASSVRTPVGRAHKGTLRATRPDELAAVAIKGALERVPQLDTKEIEDVILGCATPEAEQGMNVARIASLRAGLPVGFRRSPSIDFAPRDCRRSPWPPTAS
jgi:acetyl-CoA acyltransferase